MMRTTCILKDLSVSFSTENLIMAPVMVGNGNLLKISHIRDGILNHGDTFIPLNNVLLVPNIKKSLLSVSQLTSDFPCYFEFNKSQFAIKDLMTKKGPSVGESA